MKPRRERVFYHSYPHYYEFFKQKLEKDINELSANLVKLESDISFLKDKLEYFKDTLESFGMGKFDSIVADSSALKELQKKFDKDNKIESYVHGLLKDLRILVVSKLIFKTRLNRIKGLVSLTKKEYVFYLTSVNGHISDKFLKGECNQLIGGVFKSFFIHIEKPAELDKKGKPIKMVDRDLSNKNKKRLLAEGKNPTFEEYVIYREKVHFVKIKWNRTYIPLNSMLRGYTFKPDLKVENNVVDRLYKVLESSPTAYLIYNKIQSYARTKIHF